MTKPLTVLSFDIGIKNMAYCLLNVDEKTITMKDWCVIDISKNDETVTLDVNVCGCRNKTKLCKIKAKYEKNRIFYCDKHAKATKEFIVPENRFGVSQLRKTKISELDAMIKEFSIENDLGTNLKRSKSEILEMIETFFNLKCFNKVIKYETIKTQNIDLVTLGRNMTKILDKTPNLYGVTHVILENQISTLATRMKTIQGMLAQYFIMRFGDSIHIEFVSSFNKLKGFPKRDDSVLNTNYKNNKSDSIFYTKETLSRNLGLNLSCPIDDMKWVDLLNLKKKDDLCDCFLQGIWYLQKIKSIMFDTNYVISNCV
jgi:hypothetical protein